MRPCACMILPRCTCCSLRGAGRAHLPVQDSMACWLAQPLLGYGTECVLQPRALRRRAAAQARPQGLGRGQRQAAAVGVQLHRAPDDAGRGGAGRRQPEARHRLRGPVAAAPEPARVRRGRCTHARCAQAACASCWSWLVLGWSNPLPVGSIKRAPGGRLGLPPLSRAWLVCGGSDGADTIQDWRAVWPRTATGTTWCSALASTSACGTSCGHPQQRSPPFPVSAPACSAEPVLLCQEACLCRPRGQAHELLRQAAHAQPKCASHALHLAASTSHSPSALAPLHVLPPLWLPCPEAGHLTEHCAG